MKQRKILIAIIACLVLYWIFKKKGGANLVVVGDGSATRSLETQLKATSDILADRLNRLDPITVDTYEQAEAYFEGAYFRTIHVKSDTVYNDGDPSFYTYNPAMPSGQRVAFMGIDYDYKN